MAAGEASHKLRYVGLPVLPQFDDLRCGKYSWNMVASTAGADGTVRFVSVEPRCNCGRGGWRTCASCISFAVATWTLSLSMDKPMEWVKDGALDCDELWALPAYEGLPQAKLLLPIVTLDDPDVICFVLCDPTNYDTFADRRVWMVEVDTRRKAILSVVPYTNHERPENRRVAAKLRC